MESINLQEQIENLEEELKSTKRSASFNQRSQEPEIRDLLQRLSTQKEL